MNRTIKPAETFPTSTGKKRRITAILALIIVLMSLFCACSRPIKPKSEFITVKLGEVTFTRYFDLMPKIEFEGEECVRFSDFIDSVVTERPQIYAYRIIGSDGFYPAIKGSPDNVWEHMQRGYLKLGNRRATFEPGLDLAGRYFVKDVVSIELLRKIEVKFSGEPEYRFKLIANVEAGIYSDPGDAYFNGRAAIGLPDFTDTLFADSLVPAPEDYLYHLVSVEGDRRSFSWGELQTGWWILGLDVTRFNPDLGPDSRVPFLQTIELTPKSE
jgi:hypothetical protein